MASSSLYINSLSFSLRTRFNPLITYYNRHIYEDPIMPEKKLSETDLARYIVEYLEQEGWDCYPEAQMKYGGGRADIACTKQGILWIVEVKTSLSIRLLDQANDWLRTKGVNRVSIAFPTRGVPGVVTDLCDLKGIGILTVPKSNYNLTRRIMEQKAPTALPTSDWKVKGMIESLHPDMKNYKPGTCNGYSTPYNRTMKAVDEYLIVHPDSTLKEIVTSVQHHYASNRTAQVCILKGALRGGKERVRAKKEGNKWLLYSAGHTLDAHSSPLNLAD